MVLYPKLNVEVVRLRPLQSHHQWQRQAQICNTHARAPAVSVPLSTRLAPGSYEKQQQQHKKKR